MIRGELPQRRIYYRRACHCTVCTARRSAAGEIQLYIHTQGQAITETKFYTCGVALMLIYAQGEKACNNTIEVNRKVKTLLQVHHLRRFFWSSVYSKRMFFSPRNNNRSGSPGTIFPIQPLRPPILSLYYSVSFTPDISNHGPRCG